MWSGNWNDDARKRRLGKGSSYLALSSGRKSDSKRPMAVDWLRSGTKAIGGWPKVVSVEPPLNAGHPSAVEMLVSSLG